MASAIMRPLTALERMQPGWENGRSTAEVVEGFIKPNDRLTSFDRLEIYNRQYWFRLLDCMHDDYPGLRSLLGGTRFHRLITAYLVKHPSTSPSLRDLGSRLVRFLEEEPDRTAPHTSLAIDMARLEWAQVVAFDGASRGAATLERLAAIPPDRIFLRLQPYISLLDLSFPVDRILIRILRKDDRLRGEASNAIEAPVHSAQRSIAGRIKPERNWLLVHRQDNAVFFKRLTEPQHRLLAALHRGASLAAACETLSDVAPGPEDLQQWFATWASLGFFVPLSAGRK